MIIVEHKKDTIIISGHTNPIQCAAVSTASYTTVAALEKYDPDSVKLDDFDDVMYITLVKKNNFTKVIFENLLDVLYTLSIQYPSNIKINASN